MTYLADSNILTSLAKRQSPQYVDARRSLTVGKYADIGAVSGDPLKDFRRMGSSVFVMKNGVTYKEAK